MIRALAAPKRLRDRRGLSIIEILLAIFILAFLVLVMGAAYLVMERAYDTGEETLGLQQDATQVLEQIARDVRASRSVAVVSATEIRCFDPDSTETARYTLVASGGKNYITRSGTRLIDAPCTFLDFSVNPIDGVVRVQMEVTDGQDDRVRLDSKANLRNQNKSSI